MKKIELSGGFKNKTFKVIDNDDIYFLKEKKYDNFNFQLDYKELQEFSFVPKVIEYNDKYVKNEWVEGKMPEMSDTEISKIADILKELHTSNKRFPDSNHLDRVDEYYKEMENRNNAPEEVNKHYEKAKDIAIKMKGSVPLHNDPWVNNFIVQKDRIYLVDWELATMGDKHFDLAFFIEGSYLNEKQESVFLETYQDYDENVLEDMKFLVNYLTLIWLHRFDKLPFDDKKIIETLNKKNTV